MPFATFSLFHTATFIRTNLPKPPSTAGAKKSTAGTSTAEKDKAAPAAATQPIGFAANLNKTLQVWIKKNYEGAMRFVAYYEVIVLMGRVLFGVLL